MSGRLYQAQNLYNQALTLAVNKQGRPQPIAGVALIGLGYLLWEWNDLGADTLNSPAILGKKRQ